MIYVNPTRIEITTAPSGLPVTVLQVKERARMDVSDTLMDSTILAYINAVWSKVEEYTGLALLETKFRAFYDGFPVVVAIQKAPKIVVQKIDYLDVTGDIQTVDANIYQVQKSNHFFNIFPKDMQRFPHVEKHKTDAVMIDFQAGWSNANSIPDDIKEAILFAVVSMLTGGAGKECFGECSLPALSKSLLYKYRDTMALMR